MQIIETKVYFYDELSDSAKESAKEWWRDVLDYPWFEDSINSIKAFCDHFEIKIKDWEIGGFSYSWMSTDADNGHFRGLKLKDFDPEKMPTGYCLDCTLWGVFHKVWKMSGSPLVAFKDAIEEAVREIRSDIEYQYEDEAVEEMLRINEYTFTEDGKRF